MDSNNELKEFDIKNHTCYYFDDIIEIENFNFGNILIDEKTHGNILVYNMSYKTLIYAKPLWIRFDKINGFVIVYSETRNLVLLGSKKYNYMHNKIKHILEV